MICPGRVLSRFFSRFRRTSNSPWTIHGIAGGAAVTILSLLIDIADGTEVDAEDGGSDTAAESSATRSSFSSGFPSLSGVHSQSSASTSSTSSSLARRQCPSAARESSPLLLPRCHGKLEVRRNLEKSERALTQDRTSPRMMHNFRKGYVESDKMKYVQIRALELGQNKIRGAGFEPPANLCKTLRERTLTARLRLLAASDGMGER